MALLPAFGQPLNLDMRSWMVRAGSNGEREKAARDSSRAFAGWLGVGDLSDAHERGDVERRLHLAYPEESNYLIGNWTGQLHRFVNEMAVGDIILMPNRAEGGFTLGRITSPYEYLPDGKDGLRHSRKVEWKRHIEASDLKGDLRASLGSLLTVFEIARNDAAGRFIEVERNGRDPGPQGASAHALTSFDALAESAPVTVTVRDLVHLVGQIRRSAGAVELIQQELKQRGLRPSSPVAGGAIDDQIEIVPLAGVSLVGEGDPASTGPESDENLALDATESDARYFFPVSQLRSAQSIPESVDIDDSISVARTKMLRNNYSQLIVSNQGATTGVITWESIANASLLRKVVKVQDAMIDYPPSFTRTTPIPDIVASVGRHGYVLVTDGESVCGLVTISDLAERFSEDRLPLMLIEEIELRLRNGVSPVGDEVVRRSQANANSVDQLTLGSYVHLFASDGVWSKLPWRALDLDIMLEDVKFTADIRNSLSHFSPDPLPEETIPRLEGMLRMLRAIRP